MGKREDFLFVPFQNSFFFFYNSSVDYNLVFLRIVILFSYIDVVYDLGSMFG